MTILAGAVLAAAEPASAAAITPASAVAKPLPAAAASAAAARSLQRLSLAGGWRAALLHPLPPAASYETSHKVGPASPEALAATKPGFDDSGWETVDLPASWERLGGAWARSDGEGVFRRIIEVPGDLAGRELELRLGPIDDIDEVWINGVRVGGTGKDVPGHWAKPRIYRLKPGVVKPGPNLVAVRVVDLFSNGGFTGSRDDLELRSR